MWYGAHDADRTRDLVLTKDVLYQLSYVGLTSFIVNRDSSSEESISLERPIDI